ncbi:MAG: type II toxin-antitoxin system VapC family toxin [Armatimonadetes bacterium]|nr:type II toxin-antitoxin system VapC family toxin [Armatimonadota bacterium]
MPIGERTLDSDVLIDHLRGYRKYVGYISRYERGELKGYVSTITVAELLAAKRTREIAERRKVEKLLSLFTIVPVDISIATLAGELRRDYGLNLPDAIVAATAMSLGLVLVTRNIRHY